MICKPCRAGNCPDCITRNWDKTWCDCQHEPTGPVLARDTILPQRPVE